MIATIGAFLLPKIQKYLIWILLAIAVIVTIVLVMAKVEKAGRLQERVETMKRTIDAVKERENVRQEIAVARRTTGRSSADILRDEWSRD